MNPIQYEGAGFLLTYVGFAILGIRIKKAEDVAKDPTVEFEYFGGKPEPEDGGDYLQTAFSELAEEIGQQILDPSWKDRITPIHTFQPFSQKWICCQLLELNAAEYQRLVEADRALALWPADEHRDLHTITSRRAPVRKSIAKLVSVPLATLGDYIARFAEVPKSKNRMADAKAYRVNTIRCARLSNSDDTAEHPLRAFNTVIFEDHAAAIRGLH
jgi:hypothetical protein